MCACDEGQECARHRAESERHEDEEAREQFEAFSEGRSAYEDPGTFRTWDFSRRSWRL